MDLVVSRKTSSRVLSVLYTATKTICQYDPPRRMLVYTQLVKMKDINCDNLAWRLSATFLCSHLFGGSIRALISLSVVVIGSPTEYEKCRSMMYSVHQRSRQRATVSVPSCSSGSRVCSPSNWAIRIAWPSLLAGQSQLGTFGSRNQLTYMCADSLWSIE